MPVHNPDQQFSAVIETAKRLFCEAMDDNISVIYRKFEEARKAHDGDKEFKYSFPVAVTITPVMQGVFDVSIKAAPSSKAKIEGAARVNTEKDMVDAMEARA